VSESSRILVNAAIDGSALAAEISDYDGDYCCGVGVDVKCLGRIVEVVVDLIKWQRPRLHPERLSTCGRRDSEAFVGDCEPLRHAADSFLLKHLERHK
jgi:hypothetical protein